MAGNGDSGKVDIANHFGIVNSMYLAYPTNNTCAVSGNGCTTTADGKSMIENSCISNVRYSGGNIYFTATGAEGNAKISLTPNANGTGDIQWTWHIWCTDQPSEVLFKNNGTGVEYTVLDRNLGAFTSDPSSTDSYGLYYQFGNHNGYTWSDYDNADPNGYRMVDSYALHPRRPIVSNYVGTTRYYYSFRIYDDTVQTDSDALLGILWGAGSSSYSPNANLKGRHDGSKTIYDPCPPGYMVIPYDFLYTYSYSAGVSQKLYSDSNSMWVLAKDGTTKLVFPFNGAAGDKGSITRNYFNQGAHAAIWTSGHSDNTFSWIIWAHSSDFGWWGQGDEFTRKCANTAGMGVRCMAE